MPKRINDPMERLAREICWAGFTTPASRREAKSANVYWGSLPEDSRQNYRQEASHFRWLLTRLPNDILKKIR